jgi:hypothetical protein
MIGSDGVARVAMWSGPRNISTAMMRSWENRHDAVVVDEPFYAYYLERTGIDHPGAQEIIEQGETRWPAVVASLLAPLPTGSSVFFQKQMTLHLLDEVDRGWLGEVTNCFLIREPADVITSYVQKRPHVELDDLGFVQQTELYRWVRSNTGQDPPVLDSRDVQNHPAAVLAALCERIGVAFDEAMLSWPPGRRPSDGIWAPHWYGAVERSTGFAPWRAKSDVVPPRLEAVHQQCREAYQELWELRLRP